MPKRGDVHDSDRALASIRPTLVRGTPDARAAKDERPQVYGHLHSRGGERGARSRGVDRCLEALASKGLSLLPKELHPRDRAFLQRPFGPAARRGGLHYVGGIGSFPAYQWRMG